MGGKGKGKGGPPPPPPRGEAAAELQQQRQEQREREKREALGAIAEAKELERRRRDLESRLPTLRTWDIAAVPWEAAVMSTHLVGGKGTAGFGDSGGGVDVVELPGGAAVCVRRGACLVTESIADALAAALGVRVARMRLVQAESDEAREIKATLEKWPSLNIKADMEKIIKQLDKMDAETAACLKGMMHGSPACGVLEFVPGTSLDTAAAALEAPSPGLLASLGELCGLDLLLNNHDRLPLPCWQHQNMGNLTNAIVTPAGDLVGIDQQVRPIQGPGLEAYLRDARDLAEQVFRGAAPAAAASIRGAIRMHCGVEMTDLSLERVVEGMAGVLRRAVLEAREGRLAEVLAAAAAEAGATNFDTAAYVAARVDAADVAARDVAFVEQVVAAVAEAADGRAERDV